MILDRKIAYVDLSDRSVRIESIPADLRRKFLGGRGINMYLLSQYYTHALDPFSPGNPLIFGAGLLSGTLGFGARMSISAKSPESGHIGDTNLGGDFPAEVVKAGFSHLVITGKSSYPVYLFMNDGRIEIRDAQSLKGLDTIETQRRIGPTWVSRRRRLPVSVLRARTWYDSPCANGRKSAAGRTGMGAVMGSKNLKAVLHAAPWISRLLMPTSISRIT
jgi:aldehyde:ferredoxin oxidoreductase